MIKRLDFGARFSFFWVDCCEVFSLADDWVHFIAAVRQRGGLYTSRINSNEEKNINKYIKRQINQITLLPNEEENNMIFSCCQTKRKVIYEEDFGEGPDFDDNGLVKELKLHAELDFIDNNRVLKN